jgi:flagella basal body P-ring formation protein FlgA
MKNENCKSRIAGRRTGGLFSTRVLFLAAAALPLAAAANGAAAELRLKTQCTPAASVVTLGDIADIASADARQSAALAAIELFPAPAAGEEKVVRVREIQDLLLLRGVNLGEHQLSGANEVVIQAAAARPHPAAVRPISTAEAQRIKRRLCETLAKYLNEHSASRQDWGIEFELPEATARLFADPVAPIEVSGGAAPWTGLQRFELVVAGQKEAGGHLPGGSTTIDAAVRVIAPVVVAIRSLARGEVIREGDVTLQRVPTADKLPGAMHRLEDATGHELVRAVAAGFPVTTDTLRQPLVVHRGEVVTVLARAGGVRIRTNARAREEGSVGELVAVESLSNRTTYYARVTSSREVEVYARPPQVENEP